MSHLKHTTHSCLLYVDSSVSKPLPENQKSANFLPQDSPSTTWLSDLVHQHSGRPSTSTSCVSVIRGEAQLTAITLLQASSFRKLLVVMYGLPCVLPAIVKKLESTESPLFLSIIPADLAPTESEYSLFIEAGVEEIFPFPVSSATPLLDRWVERLWRKFRALRKQPAQRSCSQLVRSSVLTRFKSVDADLRHCLDAVLAPLLPVALSTKMPFLSVAEATSRAAIGWQFSISAATQDELVMIAWGIFLHSEVLELLSIDPAVLFRFLLCVRKNYHRNSYHNFRHAVDTLQSAYFLYRHIKFQLEPLDLLALLVASVCHDVGHPGVTNSFLVDSHSALAFLFNDCSVLENFHCVLLFSILKHPECNFTHSFTQKQSADFRKLVVYTVQQTDMSMNGAFSLLLRSRIQQRTPINVDCYEDKKLLFGALLKCADISNVARPFEISKEWSDDLNDEFTYQREIESSQIDLATILSNSFYICSCCCAGASAARSTSYTSSQSAAISSISGHQQVKSQIDFITKIALPLYELFLKMVGDEGELSQVTLALSDNLFRWKNIDGMYRRFSISPTRNLYASQAPGPAVAQEPSYSFKRPSTASETASCSAESILPGSADIESPTRRNSLPINIQI